MKRISLYFLSLFAFLLCLFYFTPNVYALDKQQSSSLGYKIPAFPAEVKDYDYLRIVFNASMNRYELLCSKGPRPYLVRDYKSGGTVYTFATIYPAGSTIVTYVWFPLSSDSWVLGWGPTYYSSNLSVTSTRSEESYRSSYAYINYNLYDSDGKIFFVSTPLMNFTIMQSSISAFLQKIFPPLITIIIPSCLVLLGVSVISLVLLPKLLKVFLKT